MATLNPLSIRDTEKGRETFLLAKDLSMWEESINPSKIGDSVDILRVRDRGTVMLD